MNIIYLGNCKNESLIEDLFGSTSELARLVEEKGNNFRHGNILVKYDAKRDIHSFFQKD